MEGLLMLLALAFAALCASIVIMLDQRLHCKISNYLASPASNWIDDNE